MRLGRTSLAIGIAYDKMWSEHLAILSYRLSAVPLGISPLVDFAFKKIFGSPENVSALIGLLNAVMQLDDPVTEVEIQNPFNFQEFQDAKQIVLDIRASDSKGRSLNIEMQVAVQARLLQRLLYYASSMYVDQIPKGVGYARLSNSISICFLNGDLHRDSDQTHHCYRMTDQSSGRVISDGIEVHTVELPKYNLSEATISTASAIKQWVFFLLRADQYDADQLREFLPAVEFQSAINVVERISEIKEDKVMYDQREKAIRDYEWSLASARQDGVQEGREEGREEGLAKGREAGLEAGREEGLVVGKIQMLQQLLGDKAMATEELLAQSPEELSELLTTLQQRLMNRNG